MTPRERVESSGTVALDQVLSELIASCTGCGASRKGNDLTAWQEFLDDAQRWVFVALCRRCGGLPADEYQALLRRLEARYRIRGTTAVP